jgi:hypothetical protein
VRRRVRCGHPPGGFLLGSILGNRLAKKLVLVLRGTPATIDDELDPVARGISRSLAQGTEQIGVEVGYTRNVVVKDRRAVGNGAVSLAKRTTVLTGNATELTGRTMGLTAKTTVLTATDLEGWCGRGGRGGQQLGAEGCGDRRDDD